jgi:hypothetical protein
MSAPKAWTVMDPCFANRMATLTAVIAGFILLCLSLSGCSTLLIDQQDHGLAVQKALAAQRLSASPRDAARVRLEPSASELKPAYDRYLLPPPPSSLTPQLP